MNDLNLLNKTELWINNITLEQANLTHMAEVVAQVLGLDREKVMVVDVRPDHITFDLVVHEVAQENIIGKERQLLDALSEIPGVHLTEESHVDSRGILGLICSQEDPQQLMDTVSTMRSEIVEKISHRAIVFPTGFELEQGLIEDTNTPYLKGLLEERGFTVTVGEIIPDNEFIMTDMLSEALNRGFGLILTTGGVGAEDKDHSVESVLALDPKAAAPYVVRYERGTGRHVKDGVRVAVGQVGLSTMITLPGPHDEVEMTAPKLLDMLGAGKGKWEIAHAIAAILAEKWKNTGMMHAHHAQT